MLFSYSRRLRAKNTCLSNGGKINRFCKGLLRGINSTATDPLTSSTTGLRTVLRKIFPRISRRCDYKISPRDELEEPNRSLEGANQSMSGNPSERLANAARRPAAKVVLFILTFYAKEATALCLP